MKLNLGAGNTKIDGFISVDLYDDKADIRADICELPFEDESIDEIVAYQVIEHVPYNKSQQMFDEMYRVLKVGGTAKVETPDISVIAKRIVDTGEISDNTIYNLVGEYYRPWDKDRYEDWEHNAASIHRNPWNEYRLRSICEPLGFSLESYTSEIYPYEENLAVCLTK
jgi:ubiquinone/menaquinone biosynthesis C-methylase UbiE